MRIIIAVIRLLLFVLFSLILTPIQWLVLKFNKDRCPYDIPELWHRSICALFKIKVKITGKPENLEKMAYVSNHLSYLDIPVIGSSIRASFVAKKDVESWPLFGMLAKLQRTVFMDRRPSTAKTGAKNVADMINRGYNLILFPEGTSTDGTDVKQFKSSLFATFFSGNKTGGNNDFYVQPMTLRLENIKSRDDIEKYAWYLEESELAPHLWDFAKGHGATVSLIFHEIIKVSDFDNRKDLCNACYKSVKYGLDSGKSFKQELQES